MSTPSVFLSDPDCTLLHGDALETLREYRDEFVDCVVTSPPYWGLRDYGQEGQLGLEPTPEQYVERMVEVFREVRRVLAPHGTCWLNLGDSFSDKQLVGIPWRVAFALQADGWYLRSDIIWSKPNPMPESVTDRPTKAHEYVFLLSKQPSYFFDQEAVRESLTRPDLLGEKRLKGVNGLAGQRGDVGRYSEYANPAGRNIRSVWEIATQPYPEAHFATFPEELARRAIAAGCPEWVCQTCGVPRTRIVSSRSVSRPELPREHPEWRPSRYDSGKAGSPQSPGPGQRFSEVTTLGWSHCAHSTIAANLCPGIVLDPFVGSGTVAHVARKLGRHSIGVDLSAEYLALAARRLQQQSLFAQESGHVPIVFGNDLSLRAEGV